MKKLAFLIAIFALFMGCTKTLKLSNTNTPANEQNTTISSPHSIGVAFISPYDQLKSDILLAYEDRLKDAHIYENKNGEIIVELIGTSDISRHEFSAISKHIQDTLKSISQKEIKVRYNLGASRLF